MTAALELEELRHRHGEGDRLTLDGVTLRVEPGELLTLVGPSGSGKSTLLRAVAGLIEPASGDIRLEGRSLRGLPPAQRNVALVFQGHALFPHLSVLDNLTFGLRARGVRGAEARARAAAERLGLVALLSRRPGQLSGGERQRVALGRALVREPRLFLLDEPLSSLDGPLRAQLREEIVRLQAQLGTAMVLVTHDQTEALGMGQRVGLLRAGRIEQLGTPEQLYQQPASLAVARFIGTTPLNVLGAEALADGALRLPVGVLALPPALHRAARSAPGALVAGVRPEAVKVEAAREGAAGGCMATVQRVEFLGEARLLTLDCAGQVLRARVDARAAHQPGDTVCVHLDVERLQLFEAESGRALRWPTP